MSPTASLLSWLIEGGQAHRSVELWEMPFELALSQYPRASLALPVPPDAWVVTGIESKLELLQ